MTPVFVMSGNGIVNPATGSTIELPVDIIEENDIVVVACQYRQQGTASSIDGYTRKVRLDNGTLSFDVFWKRAGASESSPEITHSFTSGRFYNWFVIRGATSTGDPFDDVATGTAASSASHSLPSVTTGTDDSLILAFGAATSASDVTGYSFANTDLDFVRWPLVVSSSSGFWAAASAKYTAGAAGAGTVTYNTARAGSFVTLSMVSGASNLSGSAPTVVSSSSGNVGSSPASTTLPAGVQSGDLLVLVVHSRELTAPTVAGYALIAERTPGFENLWWFTKRAGGSESAPGISHSWSGSNHTWAMVAARGVGTTRTISGSGMLTRTGSSATTHALHPFGTLSAGSLILAAAGSSGAVSFSSWSYPSNPLSVILNHTNGIGSSIGLASGEQPAAAWVAADTVTSSASNDAQTMTILLGPIPGGPPPASGGNRMGGDRAIRKPPR